MNNKLLNCLIAGALGAALALASPALARGGGGMAVAVAAWWWRHAWGGMGGGMHSAAWAAACVPAAWVWQAAASASEAAASISRRPFRGCAFCACRVFARIHGHDFFHHRFHRFAFVGAPYAYAAYDSCWRRMWTPYGLQWVNVCGDYGY